MPTPFTAAENNTSSIAASLETITDESKAFTILNGFDNDWSPSEFDAFCEEEDLDLLPPEVEAAYHLCKAWHAIADFLP